MTIMNHPIALAKVFTWPIPLVGMGLRPPGTAVEALRVSALIRLGTRQFNRTSTLAGETANNNQTTRS